MKHHEYAESIRSRGDLGPDQKNILIQDDLDRRKGSLKNVEDNSEETSEPEEPTEEEFQPVERFEYKDKEWVAGQHSQVFWVVQADSESFKVRYGPFDSLDEATEHTKDIEDLTDDWWEEHREQFENAEYGSIKVKSKSGLEELTVPYTIKKNDEYGYWGQFHPPHERDSVFVDGYFESIERAESETVQAIKSKYSS